MKEGNDMKKLISYLIAVMMVVTMMPYTAFAASDDPAAAAAQQTEIAESEQQTADSINLYIQQPNPLYSDEEPTVETIEGISLFSEPAAVSDDTEYVTTIEEAGAILRAGMVARQDEMVINMPVAPEDFTEEALFAKSEALFNEAIKHTGNPKEGDSLKWAYEECPIYLNASGDGVNFYATFTCLPVYYTTAEQEVELDAAVESLKAELALDGKTNYEKVKAIYDYMTANISYDYAHYGNDAYKLQFTAYAALVNKTSVCQGYATLFYRMACEYGIDVRVIAGDSLNNEGNSERHSWNIVKLGSQYYNLDATWDSTWDSDKTTHDFFLQSPAVFDNHTRDAEFETVEFHAVYPMSESDYVPGTDDDQGGSEGTEPDEPVVCTHAETEIIPAVEATCAENGLTEGVKCASCGKILTQQNFIPAKTHTPGPEATCVTAQYCMVCNMELVPATVEHSFGWIVDQQATEEQSGIKHEECTVCGEKRNENTEIPKLDHTHNIVKSDSVAATCKEDGNIEYYTCTKCGMLFSDEAGQLELTVTDVVIPATGHATNSDASCVNDQVCLRCGEVMMPAFGHTFYWVIDQPATEEQFGIKHEECTFCSEKRNENTVIPKLDHTHKLTSVKGKPATCIEEGYYGHYTCSVCNKLYNDEEAQFETTFENLIWPIDENNHDWSGEPTIDIDATCTEYGEQSYHCNICDARKYVTQVFPHGHKYGDWTVTKPATCTEDGLEEQICTVCGKDSIKRTLKAKGHSFTNYTDNTATCKEPGTVTAKCDNGCGATHSVFASTLDCVYEYRVVIEPTCTEVGYELQVCVNCGDISYMDPIKIPVVDHTPEKVPGVEATCYDYGLTDGSICSVCGEVLKEQVFVDRLKHNEVVVPAVPADCDYGGHSEGVKCSICNVWLVAPVIGDTPVHEYSSEYKVCQPATMQKEGYKAKTCVKCGAVGEDTVAIPRIKSAAVANIIYNGSERHPVPNIVNYKNAKLKKGKDYTVIYKNANATKVVKPKNVGKYTAVITFKGEYKGTVKRTFTINPKATAINKLTKPGKKQIKVAWQKRTAQVTGYEIQYSTTKNFTKKTTKTLKVKNFKTNVKTIKQLKAKKKYWVKIRTYKNVNGKLYYSTWSKVKMITTK